MVSIERVKVDGILIGPGFYNGVVKSRTPSISWGFAGEEKNWVQESYLIEITYGNGELEVYSFTSSVSSYVSWPGRSLHSKEKIALKITIGDNSCFGTFITGVLDAWDIPFIAAKDQLPISHEDKQAPETVFRSPVYKAQKKLVSALIYSTALGVYEVYINGTKVSDDYLAPGWTSYHHRLLHQVYDATELLTNCGEFVIGARVGAGWYSGFLGFDGGQSNIYGHHRAISLEMEVEYEDGVKEVFRTSEDWESSSGPIISAQLYNGETYDGTKEIDWNLKQSWGPTEVVTYSGQVTPQDFGYIRNIQTLKPILLIITGNGKKILDFGQNSVGFIRINQIKAPRGHKITIKHAEVMEHGELGTRPLREALATDEYICKGSGIELYTPRFTFHGFRYAQVDNYPGELDVNNFELVVISSQMEQTGTFTCSDNKINRLFQNVYHSTVGNFLSIPSDCPQRDERMGWLGDIAVFAPTALYMFDSYTFLRNWLVDVRLEQSDNVGYPAVVVPDIVNIFKNVWNGIFAAIWQDACVIVPQRLFEESNYLSILKDQYESATTWFEYIPKIPGKIRWDQIKFQLGDWLDPTAPPQDAAKAMTDPYLVADAFLYLIVDQLKLMAVSLNKKQDILKYEKLAKQCRKDFRDEYVTGNGRLVSDSQTAFALAITFGLLDDKEVEYAGNRLAYLIKNNDYKIGTGFAGTPYITEALVLSNQIDSAYKLLMQEECPSWLYPVSMGATTVWERWDSMLPNGDINPGSMTSFNHYALGSVACWLLERVGGLKRISPGWEKVLFQPILGGFTSAESCHKSSSGWIKSKWRIEHGVFVYEIEVPHNTTGTVVLPGGETHEVGSGKYKYTVNIDS